MSPSGLSVHQIALAADDLSPFLPYRLSFLCWKGKRSSPLYFLQAWTSHQLVPHFALSSYELRGS